MIENQEKYDNNRKLDKYIITGISTKQLLKFIDFNDFLIHKRDVSKNSQSIALSNPIYFHITNDFERSQYIVDLIKKYEGLIRNVKDEVFMNFAEFIRFFLFLDYFEYVNNIEITINSKNLVSKMEKPEIKNGIFFEFENNDEFMREFKDGIKINERKITKQH